MFHATGKAVNASSKVLLARSRSRQENSRGFPTLLGLVFGDLFVFLLIHDAPAGGITTYPGPHRRFDSAHPSTVQATGNAVNSAVNGNRGSAENLSTFIEDQNATTILDDGLTGCSPILTTS
jgi:hypothetical protein